MPFSKSIQLCLASSGKISTSSITVSPVNLCGQPFVVDGVGHWSTCPSSFLFLLQGESSPLRFQVSEVYDRNKTALLTHNLSQLAVNNQSRTTALWTPLLRRPPRSCLLPMLQDCFVHSRTPKSRGYTTSHNPHEPRRTSG